MGCAQNVVQNERKSQSCGSSGSVDVRSDMMLSEIREAQPIHYVMSPSTISLPIEECERGVRTPLCMLFQEAMY